MISTFSGWLYAPSRWLDDFVTSLSMIRRAAQAAYPDQTGVHRRRRLRFLLRSILWWGTTTAWLARCSNAPLRGMIKHHPGVLERMHRPFLHSRFSARKRLAVSLDHYALAMQRAPHLTTRIARVGGAPVASFSVGDERWRISLELIDQFQKEGDWTLCIRDHTGRRIVSCTFSLACLAHNARRPRLCIGAVQGPGSAINGRELFRALTKRWHGLRPKVFMVYLAQCVAAALNVNETLMVSNRAHIYESRRYLLRKRRIFADYDALSRDCGAIAHWNGWSVLPAPVALTHDEIASKTGGPRKKRETLRAELAAQITESITVFG